MEVWSCGVVELGDVMNESEGPPIEWASNGGEVVHSTNFDVRCAGS